MKCCKMVGEGPWWEEAKYAMRAELEWGDFLRKGNREERERERQRQRKRPACLFRRRREGGVGMGGACLLKGSFAFAPAYTLVV